MFSLFGVVGVCGCLCVVDIDNVVFLFSVDASWVLFCGLSIAAMGLRQFFKFRFHVGAPKTTQMSSFGREFHNILQLFYRVERAPATMTLQLETSSIKRFLVSAMILFVVGCYFVFAFPCLCYILFSL
jgi:hypothetical protein